MSNPVRIALASVRQWAISSGLSEEALARWTNVAPRTIGGIRNGTLDPRVSTLAKIVDGMTKHELHANTVTRAQFAAQGDQNANVDGPRSHCCVNDAPPEAA